VEYLDICIFDLCKRRPQMSFLLILQNVQALRILDLGCHNRSLIVINIENCYFKFGIDYIVGVGFDFFR